MKRSQLEMAEDCPSSFPLPDAGTPGEWDTVNVEPGTKSGKSFALAGAPSCTEPMTSPEIAPITHYLR